MVIIINLEKQIYNRKSCRNYFDDEIDLSLIHDAVLNSKPLNEDINFNYKILRKKDVNSRTRWSAPYYLALYSEKKANYLVNIGFIFQQVSLYLQSIGIGNCWVGMASPKEDNADFIITMAFGKSDKMSRNRDDFKRKSLEEISDFADEKLIPAQLAPSAINSQPWYFKHCGDEFDVYQAKQNILKRQLLKKWNQIDMGIALAHLYVANKDSFDFFNKSNCDGIKNKKYIGSVKI